MTTRQWWKHKPTSIFDRLKRSYHQTVKPPQPKDDKDLLPCCMLGGKECYDEDMSIDKSFPQPRVIIVGAGIAGLSAAKRLSECGINNVIILEALSRPGGRIHTCKLGKNVVEMGAQWIKGACLCNTAYHLMCQNYELGDEIWLPDRSRGLYVTSCGVAISESCVKQGYQLYDRIKREAQLFFTDNQGQTLPHVQSYFTEQIQKHLKNVPPVEVEGVSNVLQGLMNNLRANSGTPICRLDLSQYGSAKVLPGGNVPITPGGFASILSPLLDGAQFEIKYNKPAGVVMWQKSGGVGRVSVKCCDGDDITGDYVIVTLPLGFLQAKHEFVFCPKLPPPKVDALERLGVGFLTKILLEYQEPFWISKEGGIQMAWTKKELEVRGQDWIKSIGMFEDAPGCRNVLMCTVGGEEAKYVETISDAQLVKDLTTALRTFLRDPTIPCPVRVLRSIWNTNNYFLGGGSYLPPSATVKHQIVLSSPIPQLTESVAPTLFFAGEATVPYYFNSVHGARLSGIREAHHIVRLTKMFCGPPTKESIVCQT